MMHPCLTTICQEFETISDYLSNRSLEKEQTLAKLFFEFIDCFASLKEEKLDYPNEFQTDVKLYVQGDENLHKKFEDSEIRFLMLSDFYDFCRITKKYSHKKLT